MSRWLTWIVLMVSGLSKANSSGNEFYCYDPYKVEGGGGGRLIVPRHTLSSSPPYFLPILSLLPHPTFISSLLWLSTSLPSLPSSQSSCTLYHFPRFLVPGLSTAKGYALAFQAGSPNVSEFSLAILRLNEQGFLGKLTRKWWDNTNNCPLEQTTSK